MCRWSVGVLAACLSFAGCDREPTPASPAPAAESATTAPSTKPVTGDTLVVAYRGDVEGFDPVTAGSLAAMELIELMQPSLFRATLEDCRLGFTPAFAEGWDWSADGLTLTLRLARGWTWRDGEAVDVDDVMATLERVADPAAGSPRGPDLRVLRQPDPWTRVDDRTLSLHFAARGKPTDMLAQVGGTPIAPAHASAGMSGAGSPGEGEGVGAGPFVLERWEPGQRIRLARRGGDGGAREAYLDAVEVRILPDASARILAFERGDVDMLVGVEAHELAQLIDRKPETQVFQRGQRFLDFVGWNLGREPFSDSRVRTALAHAVDVEQLIDALLVAGPHRLGTRATGNVSPELCHAVDGILKPLAHDVPRARALLAEAGYEDQDGDGWVERGGADLRFELLYAEGNERRKGAAIIVQEQLREVGVQVSLQPIERLALYEKLRRGEFEAALSGWAAGLKVDPSLFWGTDGPFNFVGYSNPAADERIAEGLAAETAEGAETAWKDLQRTLYGDQPYLFLYWIDEVVVVDPRFRDVKISPVALFEDLHRWWVPRDLQRHPSP